MRPGLGWAALGAAITVGAWRMDRLESLNIEPWSAPGLVPGLLGLFMVLFGLALAVVRAGPAPDQPLPLPWARLAGVLGLTLVFVFGALGRLPFAVAAALLLFVWILMLSWAAWPATASRTWLVLRTAITSVIAALLISHLFQDVFLVRLP